MKKKCFFYLSLLIIVFSSCGQSKLFAHRSKKSKANNTSIHLSYLKMCRTSCFGRCPTYNVEVFDNGLVRFTGTRFVADTGIFEKTIAVDQVKNLFASYEKNRVDTLKSAYENRIVDLPGLVYFFTVDKKQFRVNNAHFGPDFLKKLSFMVDELVMKDGEIKMDGSWKKINSGTKEE